MTPKVRRVLGEVAFLVGALIVASAIAYVLTKLITKQWSL